MRMADAWTPLTLATSRNIWIRPLHPNPTGGQPTNPHPRVEDVPQEGNTYVPPTPLYKLHQSPKLIRSLRLL